MGSVSTKGKCVECGKPIEIDEYTKANICSACCEKIKRAFNSGFRNMYPMGRPPG